MEIYFLSIPLKKKGNFEMYHLIGQFCLFIGLCFSAIGLLGVLRFKNLYQRMQIAKELNLKKERSVLVQQQLC